MWTLKYNHDEGFLATFDSEQEYIDAMFIQIIALNYGIWLDMEHLLMVS